MIPAAIPAPQAVAETINSHCPPGLSVAPVGTTIALYRGASKTAFASFAYTGPDSVLGIVVATWRIALAEHSQPVTNITNVSNSLAAADIEEMKARSDALQILGWPGGPVEPTSWARSYLNIEAMTLSEAREAAEKAEKLQAEASVELARQRDRARALLDALRKLGYHPDMDLDEWAEARVKQRDATESSVRALESEVAAMRAEIDEMLPAGSHDLDAVRKVLLAAKGFDNSTRSTAQLAEDVAARLAATGEEADHQLNRAERLDGSIGQISAAYFDAGFGPSPTNAHAICNALACARKRGEALKLLGWDGTGTPDGWAMRHLQKVCESESLAQIRGALQDALGLVEPKRPLIELIDDLRAQRDKIRTECGLREKTSTGITICHDTAYVYSGRWARACKVLGIDPAKEPPADIAGFIGDPVARAEWQGMDLVAVLRNAMERVPPSEVEAAVVIARNHLRRGEPSSAQQVLERAAKLEIKPAGANVRHVATSTILKDGRVRVDFPSPVHEAETKSEIQKNARRWREHYEKLADALFGPGALAIPIERACVYAVEARRCVEQSVAAIKGQPADLDVPAGSVLRMPPSTVVVGVDHATGESVTCMRERDAEAGIAPADREAEKTAGFTIGSKETVGPRWTGITWMSKKGRAKTCRIEGLHIQGRRTAVVVEPEPNQVVIKVPTSPWNLPAKLVRRIRAWEKLSFHIGGGKVITGCVAKVDASAISSMLLYVAT